jgi:FKBP-type peptidyl-prolyl cis-trans isomerase
MGNYLVPKCWELTINTLHEGDKVKIKCPSYLGYGGNEKWSQFSNEKIPAFSDLIFQI